MEARSPVLDLRGIQPRIRADGASGKPDHKEDTGCLTTDGAEAKRRGHRGQATREEVSEEAGPDVGFKG